MRVREYEKRFLSNIIKYKDLYFFIVVNFIGIIIRCAGRSFISGDMEWCLIHGMIKLRKQVDFLPSLSRRVIIIFYTKRLLQQ